MEHISNSTNLASASFVAWALADMRRREIEQEIERDARTRALLGPRPPRRPSPVARLVGGVGRSIVRIGGGVVQLGTGIAAIGAADERSECSGPTASPA